MQGPKFEVEGPQMYKRATSFYNKCKKQWLLHRFLWPLHQYSIYRIWGPCTNHRIIKMINFSRSCVNLLFRWPIENINKICIFTPLGRRCDKDISLFQKTFLLSSKAKVQNQIKSTLLSWHKSWNVILFHWKTISLSHVQEWVFMYKNS